MLKYEEVEEKVWEIAERLSIVGKREEQDGKKAERLMLRKAAWDGLQMLRPNQYSQDCTPDQHW